MVYEYTMEFYHPNHIVRKIRAGIIQLFGVQFPHLLNGFPVHIVSATGSPSSGLSSRPYFWPYVMSCIPYAKIAILKLKIQCKECTIPKVVMGVGGKLRKEGNKEKL